MRAAGALAGLLSCALALPGLARSAPWLERAPGTAVRVVVWNVDRAFLRQNDDFRRVLRAIDADVLMLDEMPADIDAAAIAGGLPPAAADWHALYGSGGGPHQRASLAAMQPWQRLPAFDTLAYPPQKFEAWLAPVPAKGRERARAALEAGVPAVAGIVALDGRRVLVVGLDLQCCGDAPGSPEEQRRRFEAGAIRTAMDAALASEAVDAVLVGGDFNTVAGNAPVGIVERGTRPEDSLQQVAARHRGADGQDWTWDGRGTPFPSRPIDALLHSRGFVVLQAQIFSTEDLSAAQQSALQLHAGLSRALSPHLPIVADLAWAR